MTFTEAALAVLERAGRPMHSREIAETAVELGILSHVGKTPVQTMSACLSAAVSKGDPSGKATFVRKRPGVFALSVWEGKAPGQSMGTETVAKESTNGNRPSHRDKGESGPRQTKEGREKSKSSPRPRQAVKDPPLQKEPAGQSAPERTSEATSATGDETQGPKKRKWRRRKKRTDEPEAAKETVTTVATATAVVTQPKTSPSSGVSQTTPHSSPPHSSPPPSSHPSSIPPPAPASATPRARSDARKTNGYSLVDRIEYVLRRHNKPLYPAAIAEQIGRGGESGVTLVEALIIADALERDTRGLRPRFVEHRNGFTLAEREVNSEVLNLEQQIADSRERLVKIAEKHLLKKLRSLSMKAFIRVMAVHLQRSGFEALIPVSRNRKDEFHLSVQDRRHAGRFRTALVIRRDSAEYIVSENLVFDLRGALHHYGASSGLIVTTGAFSEPAKAEARVPNLPPIALIDGDMLCKEMVRLGIGVRDRSVSLPSFDDGFFATIED